MGQNLRPIPLAISYGRTDSVKNSGGVLWNLYAEEAPKDAKNPVTLLGSPGQTLLSTLDTGANVGPVAHGIEVNERPYFCTTKGLYKIINAGGTVKKLGAITVTALARMASNGTDIVIVDGVRVWKYTITANEDTTPTAPVNITGTSDYFPSASVTAIDSYLVFESAGSGQFFHTELNSTTIDPFSLSTAEAYPDRAVCVVAHRRVLWVFGTTSIEQFYNSGGTNSAFSRIDGATIAHGIAGPYAVASTQDALAWLSADGLVYMAVGAVPQLISTPAIHDAIEGADLSTATMISYVQNGHPLLQLTVGNVTLAYNLTTGLWHGLRDETYGRHRATCMVRAYGKNLMGDVVLPQVRVLDPEAFDNVGTQLIADIITPALHGDQRMTKFGAFELEIDTGEGGEYAIVFEAVDLIDADAFDLTDLDGNELQGTGEIEDSPKALLLFSDDDGYTWSEPEDESLGFDGDYARRVQWRRLGAGRSRRFRIQIASPVRRALVSRAWVDMS